MGILRWPVDVVEIGCKVKHLKEQELTLGDVLETFVGHDCAEEE